MKNDLIKRQDVIAKFKKTCTYELIDKNGIKRGEIHSGMTYEKIIKIIESLPSAEPEREKGKWIIDEYTCSGPETYNYICSTCGETGGTWLRDLRQDQMYPFCPNCGADMRGK